MRSATQNCWKLPRNDHYCLLGARARHTEPRSARSTTRHAAVRERAARRLTRSARDPPDRSLSPPDPLSAAACA